MNRLLIPLALVVLVAGCAMPNLFRQQADQPVLADTARTVVVREIFRETPVVYVETVYMAEETPPVQPVYVEEEYNEYNEHNETNVYVHEHVVVPPPPPRHERGWRSRPHEPRPHGPTPVEVEPLPPGGLPQPRQPKVVALQYPAKRTNAPVEKGRPRLPDRAERPVQPSPPKRLVPAQGGSLPTAQVQNEDPTQASTPAVCEPVKHTPGEGQIQVGTSKPLRK